ncbi:MAG: hypothetical protein JSW58_15585, partial [Candidatus Latescibacterota bacterium]
MRSLVLSLIIIVVLTAVAAAQAPIVAVYADASGDQCNIVDSTGPLAFYVVVTDAGGLTGVQFAAPMPGCFTGVTYLDDTRPFPVTLGNSQDGVAIGFGACLQTPVHVLTINYASNGEIGDCCVYPIIGDPNLPSGEIELTECDFDIVYGQSGPSTINGNASCPCSDKPFAPSNPSPADGAVDVPVAVTLSWDAGDPQGDPLTFDVYFGSSFPPPLVATDHSQQSYDPGTLDPETQYYWQIVARDPGDREAPGPTWTFTTLRVRPYPPSNPSPPMVAEDVPLNVTLSWDASDPQGDPMTFDVYFGASLPISPVAIDHPLQSYDVGPLTTETLYYWKIVARDSGGNETSSSIWIFTTLSERPDPPSNPFPPNGQVDVPFFVTLSWDASDPQGDPMTFDVYFGESADPPQVATDHPEQSYDVGPLTPETDHYWRIVARDPDGDETSGSTWRFTTVRERPDP